MIQGYLKSCCKDALHYSRVSKAQEVCISTKVDFQTVWEVQFLDPQYRLEMEGLPVQVPHQWHPPATLKL